MTPAALGDELSEEQHIELQDRIVRLEDLLSEFNDIQNTIEIKVENDDLTEQFNERDTFENACYKALAAAKRITSARVEHHSDVQSVQGPVSNISENEMMSGVRLPAIEISKFSGSYDAWLEFRDTFESLVHINSSLNEMQKFHYLRSSLTDGAAEVIRSVEFCSKNYSLAWELLCTRFNNDRLLVQNHLKAIFEIDNINKESSKKIRNLIDSCSKHLRSLEQLEEPVGQWDTIIIYILSQKLDGTISKEWEKYKSHIESKPTLENFKAFLRGRADLLETIEVNMDKRPTKSTKSFHAENVKEKKANCPVCSGAHFIQYCEKFLGFGVTERMGYVRKNKLCINCLHSGHYSKYCKHGSCKTCKRKHNSLLHNDKTGVAPVAQSGNENTNVSLSSCSNIDGVLLSTAMVEVADRSGRLLKVRALLDSGSQSSFVTTALCDKLRLPKAKISMSVSGISALSSKIDYRCRIKIKSLYSSYSTELTCLVLDKITGNLPSMEIECSSLTIPPNIKLADPNFSKPAEVDILIGADIFWSLLCIGQLNMGVNGPILQKTRFGWVVSGPIHSRREGGTLLCNVSICRSLEIEGQLARFWEIEEISSGKRSLSLEEKLCEENFLKTTKRASDGRFIVTIPLKGSIEQLGESKSRAVQRFLSLEKKFSANAMLRERYVDFMREYASLNHMSITDDSDDRISYYMPHHGVVKEDSVTTKLRTVFDASAPTSTGVSLNDLQMVGPKLQEDLVSILLRFREHAYVVTADITKMYSQVQIDTTQRNLQKIVWRDDPQKSIETCMLNTVTYGTASASFLAIRCLFQLASECEQKLPDIANIIRRDFYVDDMLTGANSADEVSLIVSNVTKVLSRGCFQLHKWHSNFPDIFKDSSSQHQGSTREFGTNEPTKTLGLAWSCREDVLFYNIKEYPFTAKVTKRDILSSISQIFDPLGLLSPVTIKAKMLLQKIWQEKLSWDESLPSSLNSIWIKLRTELLTLNQLKITRQVICKNPVRIELHAFSDSSEAAYGACIYIKSVDSDGKSFVALLCSKTKVAPLKTLTVPKLELCGALILARLVKMVQDALTVKFDSCTFWTDSSVVLGWLRMSPSSLKIFVGNRVSEIQSSTEVSNWRHVPTSSNPADLLSRGLEPAALARSQMWWTGPIWLQTEQGDWPPFIIPDNLPKVRKQQTLGYTSLVSANWFPFTKYSSLTRCQHVMAYIFRFVKHTKTPSIRLGGFLTVLELQNAFNFLLKIAQFESFSNEIKCLSHGQSVDKHSKLLGLHPFIDSQGILRVGGRLNNADIAYDKKHPIILASGHHLTKLLFIQEHNRLLHAGPQQLLASIRERFWVISGRNLAKAIVKKCLTCFRQGPSSVSPLMGQLPKARVQASIPFAVTGIDYGGPFQLKDRRGPRAKVTKAWICLFICFSSRAIHLELVSDLSTATFILALKRFVSRRGKPQHIYSDTGTNFKGASNELKFLFEFLSSQGNEIEKWAASDGIVWHFIPANSPHFGGLWQAGVKCTKYHLKRVLKESVLTFEEFYSLLTQIEAILNSRPISPLSCHPDDLTPLSPAHFLIGQTLTSIPEISTCIGPVNRLNRYHYLQRLKEHFWARWYKEFVSELQQRTKWRTNQGSVTEGTLVVINNLPPQQWRLGRIVSLHPGKDDIARVATIRTATGNITRALSRICPLPSPEFVESVPFQGGGHVQKVTPNSLEPTTTSNALGIGSDPPRCARTDREREKLERH